MRATLLGDEQSGHIREVGVELYQQMLEDAVAAARDAGAADGTGPGAMPGAGGAAEHGAPDWSPSIALGTPVLIPEDYVSDLDTRLGLYRRVASLVDRQELDGFAAEMIDRFGSLPAEVENLLHVVTLKRMCLAAGVEKLDVGPKGAVVAFHEDRFANPAALVALITKHDGRMRLRPDHTLVYAADWPQEAARYDGAANLLRQLTTLVEAISGLAGNCQIEHRQEGLFVLGPGEGELSVEDECGHAFETEAPPACFFGRNLIAIIVGLHHGVECRRRQPRRAAYASQCVGVADIVAVEEIAMEERVEDLALAVVVGGKTQQPVAIDGVGNMVDAIEPDVDTDRPAVCRDLLVDPPATGKIAIFKG